MACSKVTLLCVGLVAFVCLIGSGESRPASGENNHHHRIPGTKHHHKIPGAHHHHHTGGNGGAGGAGGSPSGGGGSPPGGHAPGIHAGGSIDANGPKGQGPKGHGPKGQGPKGSGPTGSGGLPGLGGGIPGLGGDGGLPGVGGVLNGGGSGGGLPGGLGGLLGGGGGGGGGGGAPKHGSPYHGPSGSAAQEGGHASRPTLAGPIDGVDDLQPTFCLDTPGYNDGAVKQFFRGTRDTGDAALDGANGIIKRTLGKKQVGGLLNGVENAGQEILCHAESGFSDLSSDFGTATQYAKHGLVDALEGIGNPSKNKGPPPAQAILTGAAGILDQTAKFVESTGSDAVSGISEGVKSLGDQTSH